MRDFVRGDEEGDRRALMLEAAFAVEEAEDMVRLLSDTTTLW